MKWKRNGAFPELCRPPVRVNVEPKLTCHSDCLIIILREYVVTEKLIPYSKDLIGFSKSYAVIVFMTQKFLFVKIFF